MYANPEIAGGQDLSGARGIAGFTNGESFRVGDPQPSLYITKYYLQQHISLFKNKYDTIEYDANQVKEIIPSSRITIIVGKFCLSDFFDDNDFSHDPRTRFLNWSIVSNGAWDYPANTRGYTLGFVAELTMPGFALRGSIAQVPKLVNGLWLNKKTGDANGVVIEVEKDFLVHQRKGHISLLGFRNLVNAPSCQQTVDEMKRGDSSALPVFNGTKYDDKYNSVKYGIGINGAIELSNYVGCFFRTGYNEGKMATWAYTEIYESIDIGLQIKGNIWKRNDDIIGIAGVVNVFPKATRHF